MIQLSHVGNHVGLLVSVRNADEARIALAGGADVIDVKEPSRGSLGAADAEVVAAVVAEVAGRAPVSIAVGELLDFAGDGWLGSSVSEPPAATANRGVAFIKIGMAGCREISDWTARWQTAMSTFPISSPPVAVAYADWRPAAAPPPDEILAAAVAVGAPALLVDTWDKSAGTLFDHWSPAETAQFCQRVRDAGLAIVLAGSLRDAGLLTAARCRPHLIAVRGAVCNGDRHGPISLARVRAVRAAIDRSRFHDKASQCHTSVTAASSRRVL